MGPKVDIAIVGYELGGLIAASFLAKQGYRVCIIQNAEQVSTYEAGDYLFAKRKRILPRLSSMPHVQYIHRQLGVEAILERALKADDRAFQLLSDDSRVDVWTNAEAFHVEIEREFPKQKDNIASLIERMFRIDAEINGLLAGLPYFPAEGWRQRKQFKQHERYATRFSRKLFAGELGRDEHLKISSSRLLDLLRFFSHLDSSDPSMIHGVRTLCNFMRGTVNFIDPSDTLEKYFAEAAKNYGVEFVDEEMIKMEIKFGKIRKIMTNKSEIDARVVLLNTNASVTQWLTNKGILKKLEKEMTPLSSRGNWSLDVMLDAAAVPASLGKLAFCLPANEEQDEMHMLRISPALTKRKQGEKKNSLKQYKVLSLSGWSCHEELNNITPQARWAQLQSKIEPFLPFADEHIRHVTSQEHADSENTPGTQLRYRVGTNCDFMGVGRSTLRSGIKNMLYTSSSVLPGLGVEGDYITALAAVRSVLNMEQPGWKPLRELPV